MEEQIGGFGFMLEGGWSCKGRVNCRARRQRQKHVVWLTDITPVSHNWIIGKLKSCLDVLIIPQSHMQEKGNEDAVVSRGLGKAGASFLSLHPHASPQCLLLPQS